MSKNTVTETVEKYNVFMNSLRNLISEVQENMENVELMSEQVTLADDLDNKIKNVRFSVRELDQSMDGIATPFNKIKNIAYEVNSIKQGVAKVVVNQEQKARQKTESAIEIARKVAGSN